MCSFSRYCGQWLSLQKPTESTAPTERRIVANDPSGCEPAHMTNAVSTRRFNWWTFFPISLLYQFRKASNCYFLFMVVLILIPGIAPMSPFSTIFPLVFVLAVSEVREFVEEYQAATRDKRTNATPVNLLKGKRVASSSLHPGDIVLLKREERVPADILVLQSAAPDGSVYVETASLDGETNLKVRRCPALLAGRSLGSLASERMHVTCEIPNVDMYHFSGRIFDRDASEPVTLDHVLWRGCTVRNTEWVAGLVVYAGQETKVMLNARSGLRPSKVTCIDRQMNRNVVAIVVLQIVICAIAASIGASNFTDLGVTADNPWYLDGKADQAWFPLFFAFVVLLSNLIPMSLWVCAELLKVIQAIMIQHDAKSGIKCNAKNIHEELGQITHIFTDKTGTLTVNKMKFVGLSVEGRVYLLPEEEGTGREGAVAVEDQKLPFPGVMAPNVDLVRILAEMVTDSTSNERHLFEALALCHTCERVVEAITGRLCNQATSPDEAALVSAAAEVGCLFFSRPTSTSIQVRIGTDLRSYTILHQIPFTSERRMMSVVVRDDSGRVFVTSKGADSSIIPKSIQGPVNETKAAVAQFSYYGFRTLCVATRDLTEAEWVGFAARLVTDEHGVNQELESGFVLLGATAVEDRLQDGVESTLRSLKAGGIKVCMITGDKRETAINIARACGLISSRKSVYVMLAGGGHTSSDGLRADDSAPHGGGSFCPLNCLDDVAKTAWPLNYWLKEIDSLGITAPSGLERNISRESTGTGHGLSKFSLVIDGKGLQSIFSSPAMTHQLVDVLTFEQCEAVVFCRVSPKQKGEIVKTVQERLSQRTDKHWSTLAIGDGANDVNMINVANVGVGIAGNEGAQAANSADYAIAQFSDLYRLLFLHGRWNYRRTMDFIAVFIYKNFACAMCQFWFATVSSFSATTVFESTYWLLFNSVFGIIPLFLFGTTDKDVDPDTDAPAAMPPQYWKEMVVPRLYLTTNRFTSKYMLGWCAVGLMHSVLPFYFTWGSWSYGQSALEADGQEPSMWMSSILVYTIEMVLMSVVTLYVSKSWTSLLVWSVIVFNLGAYFAFALVYNYIKVPGGHWDVLGVTADTFSNWQFWIILTLTVTACTVPFVWYARLAPLRKGYRRSLVDSILEAKRRPLFNAKTGNDV